MIKLPTTIMAVFTGIILVINAPNGAAKAPPNIKPMMTANISDSSLILIMKTVEAVTVTKNSAALTEPMTFLGC